MSGRGRGRGRKIQDEPERWGLWLLMWNIQKICMVHVVLSNSPSRGFNLDSCVVSGTSTCQQIQAALVPMTTKRQHRKRNGFAKMTLAGSSGCKWLNVVVCLLA